MTAKYKLVEEVAEEATATPADQQACGRSSSRSRGGSCLAIQALQLADELFDGLVVLRL